MIRLPTYMRPDPVVIEDNEKLRTKLENGEQIASNMWVLGTYKRFRRSGYVTEIAIKHGKEYNIVTYPTNAKGEIPASAMIERLMDTESGDRQGSQRNIFVDVAVNASNIATSKDKAKSYLWYLYPNEGDIKGIDDVNTKIITILPKASKSKRRVLILTGGTGEERELLAKAIDDNFTNKEKQVLAGVMFDIRHIKDAAGTYQRARIVGQGAGIAVITIDPKWLKTKSGANIVVHESVHALRDKDTSRIPELRRRGTMMVGTDSDLEESLTEAESTGREKPLESHLQTADIGYYPRLRHLGDKNYREAILDDRKTITEPKPQESIIESGRKGKRVQKLLKKNYPNTHISKLSLRGVAEAIDTYWRTKTSDKTIINTQAYNPKAIEPKIPIEGYETVKFDDGKARVISKRIPRISSKVPKLK